MSAAAAKVWVCETLNRSNGNWYVWMAHTDRAWVLQGMRIRRREYPGEKFRTVRYFPKSSPQRGPDHE